MTIGIAYDKVTKEIKEIFTPDEYCIHNFASTCNYVYNKYKGKAYYTITEKDCKIGDVFSEEL